MPGAFGTAFAVRTRSFADTLELPVA